MNNLSLLMPSSSKMIQFLFLFCLTLAAEPPSDKQELKLVRGGCPLSWFSFGGRCYKYFGSRKTWGEAELLCVSKGGNLVSIHSQEEYDFVNLLINRFDPTQRYTWIGLTDFHREGGWIWSDGSKYRFSIWSKGQPDNCLGNEHCVHTNFGNQYYWNDHICSGRFAFVCASRTVCP
ncbi:galactose-specific lectin nattectin-like [Cyprinodon tularosa]|uniref:galactose-specific lectin nattectin-like n=1 Tax=Cyprinodon tularosa TaxID=77115 RepID=UPI0018E20E6E|nr:galactose-specific lectin nattectin-like [Cyprinodon tularosa]